MTTETVEDRFRAVGATIKEAFRVDRVVAEGGFGLVYQATHLGLDRPVALKVLKTPPEYNEEARVAFMERFKEEARTVLRVKHPAVVQVIDFGTSTFPNGEEAAWTAMEWVEGATLEDELKPRRKQGGRHPADVLALLRPVLEAVAVAHDEGIAHRDLKPANIMTVRGKRTVTVRLLDFGIAKLMDPGEEAGSGRTRTTSSQVACSPRYAAPEQLSSARTGPWTDVHALGMILSEVLTDRAGYSGKDTTTLFMEALSPVRPSPAKRSIDVGAWEPVLARALAVRPDDRFANAGELLAALEAALPGATHPKAPEGQTSAATPSSPSLTGPDAFAGTAPSLPDVRVAPPDDEDDDAPPGPWASGPLSPAVSTPSSAGAKPVTASTTLRGMSADTAPPAPVAPAPTRRRALPIVAGLGGLAVAAGLAFALTRGEAPPATPVPAPAARPVVSAPLAAAVVAPVVPAVAPAVAAPVAAPVVAPVAASADAGAVPSAPAEASEGRGADTPRAHRSRRRRSHDRDYNVD